MREERRESVLEKMLLVSVLYVFVFVGACVFKSIPACTHFVRPLRSHPVSFFAYRAKRFTLSNNEISPDLCVAIFRLCRSAEDRGDLTCGSEKVGVARIQCVSLGICGFVSPDELDLLFRENVVQSLVNSAPDREVAFLKDQQ